MQIKSIIHSAILTLSLVCGPLVSGQNIDPISGLWRFFNGSFREMRPDGTSGPPGQPADAEWRLISPPRNAERVYAITYGRGAARDTLTMNTAHNQLIGGTKKSPFLTAVREVEAPQAKPSTPTPSPSQMVNPTPAPTVAQPTQPEDALTNILTAHFWEWKHPTDPSRKGRLQFLKDGTLKHPWPGMGDWKWVRTGDTAALLPGATSEQQLALIFNIERSEFRTTMPDGATRLLATRGELVTTPETTLGGLVKPAMPIPVGPGDVLTTTYGGMTMGKDWLPRSVQIKMKKVEEMEKLAALIVGSAAPGKEPVPQLIVPQYGLRWLMPLDEAIKAMGPGTAQVPVRTMQIDGFPQDTLLIKALQKTYFQDLDLRFNFVYLIADAKQHLISVMFKSQGKPLELLREVSLEELWNLHPPFWPDMAPPNNGNVEVYQDYLNETTGGSVFQARYTRDHSLGLIKLEKVHWYVPAPFARCLLVVAEHHRKSGTIR